MSYFVELQEDQNGDLILPIPEEVIETLDWEDGTLLTWNIKGDGIILQSLNNKNGYETIE